MVAHIKARSTLVVALETKNLTDVVVWAPAFPCSDTNDWAMLSVLTNAEVLKNPSGIAVVKFTV